MATAADAEQAKSWLRQAVRPGTARCWLDIASESAVSAARSEARALVHQPGGGRTYWLDDTTQERCALEAVAKSILRFHQAIEPQTIHTAGLEWWVQVRSPDDRMSIHWDCDEELKGRTGEHVPPYLATVTYLTSAGAPTIVLPVGSCCRGRAVVHEDGQCYASFPLARKHLAFDGRLLHGAERDDDPAADEAECERVTLLVNIWVGYQPCGIEPLSDELVGRLPAASRRPHGCTAGSEAASGRAATLVPAAEREATEVGEAGAGAREWPIGSYHHPPIFVERLAPLVRAGEHFWRCRVAVGVVGDAGAAW